MALNTHRTQQAVIDERRDYISKFNPMMIQIWREQMVKLGTIRSGRLYSSATISVVAINGQYTDVHMEYGFNEYGVYVDRGTGRETYKGNPGDIGRDKSRKAKKWMTPKYFMSFFNIRDFFAESMGQQFCAAMTEILTGQNNTGANIAF